MTKQTANLKSAMTDVTSLFDPRAYQDLFRTVAEMNERFTGVMVEAGQRTTEITGETARETLSNLRDATAVRNEPSDYAKAYGDFLQRQVELFTRTAQSFADMSQKTGTAATEVASDAGSKMAEKVSETAEKAANTATSAAKKAA